MRFFFFKNIWWQKQRLNLLKILHLTFYILHFKIRYNSHLNNHPNIIFKNILLSWDTKKQFFMLSSSSLKLVPKSVLVLVMLHGGHCLLYLTKLYINFRQRWPILCHHFNTILNTQSPKIGFGIGIGIGIGIALSLLCIYFHLALALFSFILLQIPFVIMKLISDYFNGKCPQCWVCHIWPQAQAC